MAEYIEREAAKRAVGHAIELNDTEFDIVCDYIDRIPVADVASVKHGVGGRLMRASANVAIVALLY